MIDSLKTILNRGSDNSEQEETRVLVITQLFPPESMGGAHRWLKLCQKLPENQCCHVIAPPPTVPIGEFSKTNRIFERNQVNGISVSRLWTYQSSNSWSGFGRVLNYGIFAVYATMYVLLNFWRFDTVITLIGPHTILFPGLVASVLRRSWIIDIYDFWLDNAVDMGFTTENAIGYRLLAVVERISLNRADHILVLTPTLGEQYREKYNLEKEKFTSVPFGIDLEMFSPDSARDSHERIIYTGKLGKAQAFEPFFEGFARLDVDYELLIVGFGDRRDELERLATSLGIDERVTFRDAVSRNQIPELVSSSTVSLVPLSKEYQIEYARPTKFVETMAVGTPFIASNLPEITSVTERSEAGIVVPNEPTAITNAMNKIINDNKLRKEMRENGVAFSEEYHCWDRIANKVEIVISNVEHDPNEEEL